jgi:hypothetical protein
MTAPQRYSVAAVVGDLVPADSGDLVLFADVEQALRDAAKARWMQPLLDGSDDRTVTDARGVALYVAHGLGLRGDALLDEAMRRCPA